MNFIAVIFWNRGERRLRAGWRLGVQLLAMILVGTVWQLGVPGEQDEATISAIGSRVLWLVVILGAWRVLDRRTIGEMGLRIDGRWWLECLGGFVLGGILIGGVFMCEWRVGWVVIQSGGGAAAVSSAPVFLGVSVLFYYVVVGFFEEAYFRGYLLRNFADGVRCRWLGEAGALLIAAGVTAILFASAHIMTPSVTWLSKMNTLLAGVMLVYLVLARGNLAAAIGFHIGWNYLQGGVLGFAVSGGEATRSWIVIEQSGPEVWTGGAYGPEGGLLGTLAFSVGLLAVATHQLIWGRLAEKRIANEE